MKFRSIWNKLWSWPCWVGFFLAISASIVQAAFTAASDDPAATLINHYYLSILEREPEPDGFAYWQGLVAERQAQGDDVSAVFRKMAIFFFNGTEYISRNATDRQFITHLYLTFFQREPDEGGYVFWLDQLANGMTRNQTLGGFLYSDEFTDFMQALGLSPPPSKWWMPRPGVSWQWQLTGPVDTHFDVDMYDIDLFDTPRVTIDELHDAQRVVICYFSAGSYEIWRSDADRFATEVLGQTLDGWPGERWLDIRNLDVLAPIMEARLDLAVDKGCDGVEPDNIDGYSNPTGFDLSAQDQLVYNRWLARAAHARGLSIGLKNNLDQVRDLVVDFDWALNEQCFEYDECDLLVPFVEAGKAVFGVEYRGQPKVFCPWANAMHFDWLWKRLDLDAWRVSCR